MLYPCSCPLCCGASFGQGPDEPVDPSLSASLVREISPAAPRYTVISNVISGDSRIDALLVGTNARLNIGSPLKTPATVTYSFPAQMPAEYSGNNAFGWKPFSVQQQAAARDVLNVLQKQVNLTFFEVSPFSSTGGTIRFSDTVQYDTSGYAYLPSASRSPLEADIFISTEYATPLTKGSFAWNTLVHEIGHAMGLKHPGNYNAGQANSTDTTGNYLGVNEDTYYNSIMSYRDSGQGIHHNWFMPYDLLALRYLYGKRAFETGNNTYRYTDAVGLSVANIVDDGGSDTLDFSALTASVNVNLNPGAYSSVGRISSGALALANLTTSLDAVIENVIGTRHADIILGNAANNVFTGGGGNDILNTGAGIDVAVLSGPRSRYTLGQNRDGKTILDRTGADGNDSLIGVERLHFSDAKMALDLDGHAGETVKLMGAVFGKHSVTHQGYIGAGLRLLDAGMSFEDLGTVAVRETGVSDHASIVSLLWVNLFEMTPTPVQSSPYVSMLDRGVSVGALAALAAEEATNLVNIDLIGLSQAGVLYI
jgi:serralysin